MPRISSQDLHRWMCRNCQQQNRESAELCVSCGRQKFPPFIDLDRLPESGQLHEIGTVVSQSS